MASHLPATSPVGANSSPGCIGSSHGSAAVSPTSLVSAGVPPALGPPHDQHIKSDFLGPGPLSSGRKLYLIVLNYCLPVGLLHVWPLASFRICADGGCNRLFDELPSMMPPPPGEIGVLEALAEEDLVPASATDGPSTKGTNTRYCSTEAQMSGWEAVNGARAASPLANDTCNGTGNAHAGESDPHHDNDVRPAQPYHQRSAAGLGLHTDVAASLHLAYMPDVVLGDLDSIRSDVRQYYTKHGVPIMDLSADQDTNDLAKAIMLIEERYIRPDTEHGADRHEILVLGALGGRLDHTLANLNALHMFPHLNVTLWGDGNLVRLVRPGRALITPDERFEGPTCGLIPIAGPVTATSSGLKWNVAATQLRVGGLVSSSNLLTGEAVQVECDGPLLWSTELCTEPRPDLRTLWARTAAAAAAARERERQRRSMGATEVGAGAVEAMDAPAPV